MYVVAAVPVKGNGDIFLLEHFVIAASFSNFGKSNQLLTDRIQ